jgi:hypothetical protein
MPPRASTATLSPEETAVQACATCLVVRLALADKPSSARMVQYNARLTAKQAVAYLV